MTYKENANVQDVFLNCARKSKVLLTIFLINGVKLQGTLVWFDPQSLLLKKDGSFQLIYKHAISTLMPHGHMDMFERSSTTSEPKVEQDDCSIKKDEAEGG
jgi:host factor-I protein